MTQPISGYSGSTAPKGSSNHPSAQTDACSVAKAKEKTDMKLFESKPDRPTKDEQTQMLFNSLNTIYECKIKPFF
jgi:hypothetical protein